MSGPSVTNSPTNPYHISRAYGAAPTAPAGASTVAGRTRGSTTAESIAAPRVAQGGVTPGMNANVRRLVAGVVPGRIDFTAGVAMPSRDGVIPMYRHPADKNAAAVAVHAGRTIDVNG